jgi:ferredoxin
MLQASVSAILGILFIGAGVSSIWWMLQSAAKLKARGVNARLVNAAEGNGVEIPSSCRQGQCGTCAPRLVRGEASLDADDGLSPELRQAGSPLTCVGHPKGDVELDA